MNDLLHQIASRKHLDRAWDVVKRNNVAAGLDRVTVEDFEASKYSNITKIRADILNKKYVFQASRQAAIPKSSGGKRNIHVYTVRDKVVQQAIQSLLLTRREETSLFPEVYNDVAVAYIPQLNGVRVAIDKVKKHHSEGYIYLTNLDIKDYFDNIPHQELLNKILNRLHPDDSIDWLIEQTINQQFLKRNDIHLHTVMGVAQGSVLAPFYSNVHLADFDKALSSSKIRAIRYADDLAIFSKSSEEAKKNKALVRKLLKDTAKMDFYPDGAGKKSPKDRCINHFAEFLGVRFSKSPKGYLVLEPSLGKVEDEKKNLDEKLNKSYSLHDFIFSANLSINSWACHYYGVGCHNSPMRKALKSIFEHYSEKVLSLLKNEGILSEYGYFTLDQLHFLGMLDLSDLIRANKKTIKKTVDK